MNDRQNINGEPDIQQQPDWQRLFVFLCLYTLMALTDLPHVNRPWFLTVGVMTLFVMALFVLFRQLRNDRSAGVLTTGILIFWTVLVPPAVNGGDDNMAYLVFAQDFYDDFARTFQPLSERRLFSVGGNYALQAPVLHWCGVRGLAIVEPAFGLVLLFILLNAGTHNRGPVVRLLLTGVLGMTPFAGSSALANTSSVFVLAAFSAAIVMIGARMIRQQRAAPMDLILLALLPLTAAVYRPTTAPFNFLVAGAMACYAAVSLGRWRMLAAVALPCLALFFFSLVRYHECFGTYLYPLLGRGNHITAEGYSIGDAIAMRERLSHMASLAFRSPILMINVCMLSAAIVKRRELRERGWNLIVLLAYLAFCAIIVVSTGGLASSRYVFPVSVGVFCVVSAGAMGGIGLMMHPVLRSSIFRVRWCLTAGILLSFGMARWVGGAAVERRMLTLAPDELAKPYLKAIQERATQEGAALFISTGYERYIAEGLRGKYMIMDLPGMMVPWNRTGTNYGAGFRAYLKANNVSMIVFVPQVNASRVRGKYSGWHGLMNRGNDRHDAVMDELLAEYGAERCGPFTIVVLSR